MKKAIVQIFSILISVFILNINISSCQIVNYKPIIDTSNFLNDVGSWWNYNHNIILSENYIALDISNKIIDRKLFLQLLSTGDFVVIKLSTPNNQLVYKLVGLDSNIDNNIKEQAKSFGQDAYHKFLLEGKEIPDFDFVDVNGKVYNKLTTQGKVIILKCWFIHCATCVQEIPELNKIVKQFQKRQDVLFISLAFDKKEDLQYFLQQTEFKYAIIPVTEKYIEEKLKVTGYPTQFIIDKTGHISKVINDYHELVPLIKRELDK